MIAIPGNVRVWLATGHTDMRRGFPTLTRLVEEGLKRDPRIGHLYVFRGRRGDPIKIIWHDDQGARLFTVGARPLSVAIADRRRSHDRRCAIVLPSARHRLADAAGNPASTGFRMS